MISRIKTVFTIILFIFISTNLFSQQNSIEKIDSYIQQAIIEWKMPGFAVAIVKNDSVVFAKGYGVRDVRTNEPVDEKGPVGNKNSRFRSRRSDFPRPLTVLR